MNTLQVQPSPITEYRYRRYIRWGIYWIPLATLLFTFPTLVSIFHIGGFYVAHSVKLIQLLTTALLLICYVPLWIAYNRMRTTRIWLDQNQITVRTRGKEKTFSYNSTTVTFRSAGNVGGWMLLRSGMETTRITIAVENISRLARELKKVLDAGGFHEHYNEADYIRFLKTAINGDRSFERIRRLFGRWNWIFALVGVIILSTALGYGFAALGDAIQALRGFSGVGFFVMLLWMLVIALWFASGGAITEIAFIRQMRRKSDEEILALVSPTTDIDGTIYNRTLRWGSWSLFIVALLLTSGLFIFDVGSLNLGPGQRSVSNVVGIIDHFDAPANGWAIGKYSDNYGQDTYLIQHSKYHWDVTAIQGVLRRQWPYMRDIENFTVAVDINQLSGPDTTRSGIVFRNSQDAYYVFEISAHQQFGVWLWNQNQWTTLKELTTSDAIKPNQVNRLMVIAQGTHFDFFINNQAVAGLDDNHLTKGKIGLSVDLHTSGDQASIEFGNFTLVGE